MSEVECPYCEKEMDAEGEDVNLHTTWQMQCYHCEKEFMVESDVLVTHSARKANCLNGDDNGHRFIRWFGSGKPFKKCDACGKQEIEQNLKGGE